MRNYKKIVDKDDETRGSRFPFTVLSINTVLFQNYCSGTESKTFE